MNFGKVIERGKQVLFGLLVIAFILFTSTGGAFLWIFDIWGK